MEKQIDKYQEQRIQKLEEHIETINKELGEINVSIAKLSKSINGRSRELNFCFWLIGVLMSVIGMLIKGAI